MSRLVSFRDRSIQPQLSSSAIDLLVNGLGRPILPNNVADKTAALKSMLIIPRTPTPPPLEERDPTTLNADELRELQKRAQAFKVGIMRLEIERMLTMRQKHQEGQVKIKREKNDNSPRRRKAARPHGGGTQYEFDDGNVRESSTPTPRAAERVIIEIDSGDSE